MKLFRRHSSTQPPSQRRVNVTGRTAAFVYHAQRFDQQASLGRHILRETADARQRAKKAVRYGLRRLGLVLIALALIAAILNSLWLSPDAIVKPLSGSPTAFLHPLTTYQSAADTLLGRSFWDRFKLSADTTGISAALKKQFPELSDVSIDLPLLGHRPLVYIVQSAPVLALRTSDGRTYVIDSTGRALGAADALQAASLHLVTVRDTSGAQVQIGQLAVSSTAIQFVQAILFELGRQHLQVASLVLPGATSELDMQISGEPYIVKFNLASNSARQQIGTYLAVKHNLEGKGVAPQQYIDVRVDGRAYYK